MAEDLRRHFAHDQVFQDIHSIDPGADFIDALKKGLDECAAVVVVIGPGWISAADRKGRRRLDSPDDWVRQEIAESLRRPEVRVFPVLVGDAEMPAAEDLPEPLRPLTRRQAFDLTSRHWSNDVDLLVEHLKRVPGLDRPAQAAGAIPVMERPHTGSPPPTEPEALRTHTETAPGGASGRSEFPIPFNPLAILGVLGIMGVIVIGVIVSQQNGQQPEAFRDCEQCPEMVMVPAGSLVMGSPENEAGRDADEGPQRTVTIARPFAVGNTK